MSHAFSPHALAAYYCSQVGAVFALNEDTISRKAAKIAKKEHFKDLEMLIETCINLDKAMVFPYNYGKDSNSLLRGES